jgi:small subunit ribosomal protein S4e
MITGGNNIGRIGNLQSLEKHPGSYEIAHVKDSTGNSFSTRIQNILVIGDGKTPAISIPKGDGIRLTLVQERDARFGQDQAAAADSDEE